MELFLLVAAGLLGIWLGGIEPTIRRNMGAQAEEQINAGNYGGCLETSVKYVLIIILGFGLIGLLGIAGYAGAAFAP